MSSATDPYDALADVYDLWQEGYGCFSESVLEQLEQYVFPRMRADTSFVDLGCGTGTLLLLVAKRQPSWRLTGIDASDGMLSRARAKRRADRIEWRQARLGDSLPGEAHDLVGSFFNTVNHLPSTEALEKTCGSVSAALRPGGLFIFDVNNEIGYRAWWGRPRTYSGPGWQLAIDSSYDAVRGTAHVQLRVDRRGVRHHAQLTERLFTEREVEMALRAASFDIESRQPWSPLSDGVPGVTFWIARRV